MQVFIYLLLMSSPPTRGQSSLISFDVWLKLKLAYSRPVMAHDLAPLTWTLRKLGSEAGLRKVK